MLGLQTGDTTSALVQVFDSRNAGPRILSVVGGFTINDGNGGNNYALTVNTASGLIQQRALTVSAVTDTKIYDGTVVSAGAPIVLGLQTADSTSALAQVFDSRNAGARTLSVNPFTVNDGNAGNNYALTTNTASGAITPAALTLAAASDTKTYDATVLSNGTPNVTGLRGSDTVTGATQSFDLKNAGARTLSVNNGFVVNDGNAGNNYTVARLAVPGAITPEPLTVAANDASITVGAPIPPFSARLSGFVGGETPSVLGGTLTLSTPATPASLPGKYAIVPAGLTSSNYAITFVPGTLQINTPPLSPQVLPSTANFVPQQPTLPEPTARLLPLLAPGGEGTSSCDGSGSFGYLFYDSSFCRR